MGLGGCLWSCTKGWAIHVESVGFSSSEWSRFLPPQPRPGFPLPAELMRKVARTAHTSSPPRKTADLPYLLTMQRLTCDGGIIVTS